MGNRLLAVAAALILAPALPSAGVAAAAGDPNPAADEWVDAVVTITLADFESVDIHADLAIHKATFLGASFTADRAREVYAETRDQAGPSAAEGFVSDLEAAITAMFEERIRAVYPTGELTVQPAVLDLATLDQPPSGDRHQPPITFDVEAAVPVDLSKYGIEDLDAGKLETALAIGALLEDDLALNAGRGWNVTYVLRLPDGIVFEDAPGATVGTAATEAMWTLSNWRGSQDLALAASYTVAGEGAPHPTEEEAKVLAVIDLRDVAIDLAGSESDVAALDVGVDVVAELAVLEVPAELTGDLAGVSLSHITADGIRLALAQGLISQASLDDAERRLLSLVSATLMEATGRSLTVTGGFDPATLSATLVGAEVDGSPPILFHATTSFRMPLGLGPGAGSGETVGSAVTLYSFSQSLDLVKVEGLDTDYKFLFPRGIRILDVDVASGAGTTTRGREAGRDFALVAMESERATAEFTLAVTPSFVVAKFLGPLVIVGILLLLLLLLVARAVRGGSSKRAMEEKRRALAKQEREERTTRPPLDDEAWFGDEP